MQVLAAVFGPKEATLRSQAQQDKAIVRCEYAMAAFSTGGCMQGAPMQMRVPGGQLGGQRPWAGKKHRTTASSNAQAGKLKCSWRAALRLCATAESRRRRGKSDRRSTELSLVIKNTLEQTIMLELLPRSQIDVYVQVRCWSHAGAVR